MVGVGAMAGRDDPEIPEVKMAEAPVQNLPDDILHEIPSESEVVTDDDHLRIEHLFDVHEAGGGKPGGEPEALESHGISPAGAVHDLGGRNGLASRAPGILTAQGAARRILFPTARVAARAGTAVGEQNGVPEFGGLAGGALQQLAVDDHAGTQTVAGGHEDEVVHGRDAGRGEPLFGERREARVVLEVERYRDAPRQHASGFDVVPAEIFGGENDARGAADGARQADTGADERVGLGIPAAQFDDRGADLGQEPTSGPGSNGIVFGSRNDAVEIGGDHSRNRGRDLDADGDQGLRLEPKRTRTAAESGPPPLRSSPTQPRRIIRLTISVMELGEKPVLRASSVRETSGFWRMMLSSRRSLASRMSDLRRAPRVVSVTVDMRQSRLSRTRPSRRAYGAAGEVS